MLAIGGGGKGGRGLEHVRWRVDTGEAGACGKPLF